MNQEQTDAARWRLADIYETEGDFEADCAALEALTAEIGRFRGTLHTAAAVADCFAHLERMQRIMEKLLQYANLVASLDQADSAATARYARAQQLMMRAADATAYREPELYANPDTFLDALTEEPRLRPYLHQIARERAQKAHQLPEEQEILLTPLAQQLSGADTLFSKLTNADIEFPSVRDSAGKEQKLSESVYGSIMSSSGDRTLRRAAAEGLRGTYGKYRNTLSQNMDNFVQGVVALAHAHRYETAKQASLESSSVPVAVYDALLASADAHLTLPHRAVALRRRALGYDEIATYDTNIPLAHAPADAHFTYGDAQRLVGEATAPLGERYRADLQTAFDSRWADVYPAPAKSSGAFAAPLTTVHPYVLLNFMDDYDSVSTTAHEMGHAMHQFYSANTQESAYNSDPTIFTSEVASTANELLLSDAMLHRAKTREEQLFYLSSQLNLLQNTFFQQVMYSEFEDKMYGVVEQGGSLTPDTLEGLWLETCRRYYGPEMHLLEQDRFGWSRIPHFYYQFYVFQYATSISAACDIVSRIESGAPGAVQGYLDFLHAGDSLDAVPTLALAGVDAAAPETHEAFYKRYAGLIDRIGALL